MSIKTTLRILGNTAVVVMFTTSQHPYVSSNHGRRGWKNVNRGLQPIIVRRVIKPYIFMHLRYCRLRIHCLQSATVTRRRTEPRARIRISLFYCITPPPPCAHTHTISTAPAVNIPRKSDGTIAT